ncbi:MAG TPA: monovalent cation/H(+) antiporter subunit G [Synergistaceae bacterium]|nr:monovalent cation/H(+) antiporter subunit G [Synergistaceae bacterium]HPJ25802.1 monovalent cation/H(+) antiporter subunit G [Synergistaceae bacterium]HPQ37690.1 monovalent cation/H(+) antiporter subunit G [Synergistaceae bacterium]
MSSPIALLSGVCMLGGTFFALASVIGILRFPDVYTRLHAGTKALSGGAILILLGVALRMEGWQGTAKIFMIILFLLGTNPLASHAIARSCYRHGILPRGTREDDYASTLHKKKGGKTKKRRRKK